MMFSAERHDSPFEGGRGDVTPWDRDVNPLAGVMSSNGAT